MRSLPRTAASSASTAVWQPLGPSAVVSPNFGLVTGRVSSIAIDPADPSGNRVYIGTTGGGVWVSQNAAASDSVIFTPLTDSTSAFNNQRNASISIGALTVQPGGTNVILAGTGDPNDALDSYYGAGVMRSADGGNTWTSVSSTADQLYSMGGEGFAGFAWSTINPQLVVAAVSEAYEGTLVNAQFPGDSYAGLYYSTDAGATWSLSRITDGGGLDVQGQTDMFAAPNGNSATAVIWNPVRQLFIAAIRFHGYYQSTDGITWTRMAAQPGTGLTAQMCPTNPGTTGSEACPIFRGALAVNPVTGDTFAWTVDLNNQDQGIWQDACGASAGTCGNQAVAFAQRWSTAALGTNTTQGASTIGNGDYNLVLAAVPAVQDTLLLAGANDLWKCSLALGCVWRNTTNASSCMSAAVAPYQHAVAWNSANPQEILIGNDSGLWRSIDAVAETGSVCSAADASHFQNLNAGLGSLTEVESMSQVGNSPYTMMAGLGANGTAGVKSITGPTEDWPQILGGEGGAVAIDPEDSTNWYVNNSAGVSIHRCSQSGACSPAGFGVAPVVDDADVSGDGYTMTSPAPFVVDPLDHSRLLVGTCRLWRGPVAGGWTGSNAISPIFDGISGQGYCSGDALIRVIAALPVPGGEVIYVGMFGALDGGAVRAGHVFRATFSPNGSSMPSWQDLTLNPVVNDQAPFNYYGLDISSISIDPHDTSGNTAYVTVEGIRDYRHSIRVIYRTTDGGAHWTDISSNLPQSPANSVVIDPLDSDTVYVATDEGVYSTRQVASCAFAPNNCWSVFGAELPYAPVVQLSAAPAATSPNVLVAGTYGRGIWQIPLWTAGIQVTTASAQPGTLTFAAQGVGTTSSAQTVVLTNTGGIALTVSSIAAGVNFGESDNCVNVPVNASGSCAIQVTFTPGQTGTITDQVTIIANVAGGQITIPVSGTGSSAGQVTALPGTLSFGQVEIGASSASLPVTVENASSIAVPLASVTATPPFSVATNACGNSLAANSDCAISVAFTPTQAGTASGTLTLVDSAGTQTVALNGIGATAPTDVLSASSLSFPGTVMGQQSDTQNITLSNNGDMPLTSISVTASEGFQTTSTCGGKLTGEATCAISVQFAPTSTGNISGSLTVSDAIRTQTVALSGIGLQPPAISVNPVQLAFPAQPIGQGGLPLTLTVSNTGGAPMANVGFQITGQSAPSFSLAANTCGNTLSRGGSCTVQVAFTPAVAGQLGATLTVSSSTLGVVSVQLPLSGIGQAASGIIISPSQMAFTQPTIGQASAAQTATITNTSNVGAAGLAIAATSPFSLSANTCTASLAVGASCTTGVVFTPASNGLVAGTLTVTSSSFVNGATTTLTGAGGAAGSVQLSPASMTYTSTGVGSTSAAQTATLTNNGPLALNGLVLSTSTGFQVASTTCGSSLSPAASCNAQITFAPTSAGQQSGSLTIASSSLATSAKVSLSGMAFDFSIASSGQSSQTIASGQTASYTVTLAPMSGSSGTFAFSCGSLPANATCTFNPSTETVSPNGTGTVTVQIATGRSSSSAQNTDSSRTGASYVLPVAFALSALPFAFRRRRYALLAACLLISLGGITSCASSGGGTGGSAPPISPNNTPAGTYSIDVTATANGLSHKVTLTLTVD